jgi:HSP20 family molecular chaperone IbpA
VLPDEVDPDGVEATLQDGVLTILAPKRAADQGRTHHIGVSQPTGDR